MGGPSTGASVTAVSEVVDVWARPIRVTILALVLALAVVLYANFMGHERAEEVTQLRGLVDSQQAQIEDLSAQVGASQRSAECRSRATAMLDEVEGRRDALGWQALVDRFVAGTPLEDRPQLMAALNAEATSVAVLRARAVIECTDNPDFIPPS